MIILGRITGAFGIKGWVRIHPFGDDPLSWRSMRHWWLAPSDNLPDEQWRSLALLQCKMQGDHLVAAFEGVNDRSAAEALDGYYIAAPREDLPRTAKDEYYWADLVGLAVVNQQQQLLGHVSGLLSTGVHEVLQVQDGDIERLIPFVAAYVGEVDLAARRIMVDWQADW